MDQVPAVVRTPARALRQVCFFVGVVGVLVIVAAGAASAPDSGTGGATPYTPTQGEWLCLMLNAEQGVFNGEQQPTDVHVRFLYDRSKPNTIEIELLGDINAVDTEMERQRLVTQQRVLAAAKDRGWDQWLKIEVKAIRITGPPTPQMLMR